MELKHQLGLVCIILLLPVLCSATSSSYPYTKSRATYYNSPGGYGTSTGACGFGDYGRTVYGGSVAGVSGLWRGGSGCGACYRVWCRNAQLCNPSGTILLITDYGQGDRTDFIMSLRAFSNLGRNPSSTDKLKKQGTVDIEYERVPCKFPNTIKFKVDKNSNNPGYFAGVPINVAGKCDVVSIELWQQGKGWVPLRRTYGAVFDFQNPPSGQIVLRFKLDCGGVRYVKASKPLPGNWKGGVEYDTGVQF